MLKTEESRRKGNMTKFGLVAAGDLGDPGGEEELEMSEDLPLILLGQEDP